MTLDINPLVILPTFNEIENIEEVLNKIRISLPQGSVLVVDDNSPDGTADKAEELSKNLGRIQVLRRQKKSGLGSAYRDGFSWGIDNGFNVLIEMDADLSHDPAALGSLVDPFQDSFDLVIGSRYIPGGHIPNWSWQRRLLSKSGNQYAKIMLGLPVNDSTAGFRAYSASILKAIDLSTIHAEGYGFQIEMTYAVSQLGGKIKEVPISFVDRVRGTSKMSINITLEALWLVTKWGVTRKKRAPAI